MARPIITYPVAPAFERRVAYFSMEFAVDQALKIYSGGLGFLAGSHIRSARTWSASASSGNTATMTSKEIRTRA